MKKLIVALLSAAGIALGSASAADSSDAAKGEKREAVTEALVRQRVEDWAKAVRAKDIDGVMSLYATNNVSFDLEAFRADEGGISMESRIRNERDNHRPNERRKR